MSDADSIQVLFFARARDLAGMDRMATKRVATLEELRLLLGKNYPRLVPLLDKCAFAVNGEFAGDMTVIPPGAEVALLPPVSGG
jgi:molybdopterin converting factor subunit 1